MDSSQEIFVERLRTLLRSDTEIDIAILEARGDIGPVNSFERLFEIHRKVQDLDKEIEQKKVCVSRFKRAFEF
jgi:hypothetical protein